MESLAYFNFVCSIDSPEGSLTNSAASVVRRHIFRRYRLRNFELVVYPRGQVAASRTRRAPIQARARHRHGIRDPNRTRSGRRRLKEVGMFQYESTSRSRQP